MDRSKFRRGQKCWYLYNDIGLNAINDGLLLEQAVFQLLRTYFKDKPCYVDLMETFHEVKKNLIRWGANSSHFTTLMMSANHEISSSTTAVLPLGKVRSLGEWDVHLQIKILQVNTFVRKKMLKVIKFSFLQKPVHRQMQKMTLVCRYLWGHLVSPLRVVA